MPSKIKDIKYLNDTTKAGLYYCKKAYEEANGDVDKALEILEKDNKEVVDETSIL